MPLSPELEALCAEIDKVDPVAGKAQRELLEKHPTLQTVTKEQRLRQEDYTRKLEADKKKIQYGETMQAWADKNVPKFNEMEKERDAAIAGQQKAEKELETKVAAAVAEAAAKGTSVDADKLVEAVRGKLAGEIVSKTELSSLVNAEAKKLVDGNMDTARKTFYEQDVPKLAGLNAAVTEAQIRFGREFTDDLLDPEAYVQHLANAGEKYNTDGKFDRKKAYDAFVAQKRADKGRDADVEKRAKERADAILAERGVSAGFPGTSGAPGPLQMRFNTKDPKDPLFGAPVELGDGSAAAAAAAEFHAEGK